MFLYSLSSNLPISLVQVPSPSHPFSHLSSHFFHFFSYCHFISSFIRLFPSLAFTCFWLEDSHFCVCVSLPSNSSTSFYYHCIHPSVSYSLFLPLSFFSPLFLSLLSIVLLNLACSPAVPCVSKWCINPGYPDRLFMLNMPHNTHTHTGSPHHADLTHVAWNITECNLWSLNKRHHWQWMKPSFQLPASWNHPDKYMNWSPVMHHPGLFELQVKCFSVHTSDCYHIEILIVSK